MNRRSFLRVAATSVAGLWLVRTSAQTRAKPLKIGFLSAGSVSPDFGGHDPDNLSVRALLQGLRDLGYRYGTDVVFEIRSGDGRPDRYADLARELVAANVDVIVAGGPTIDAARRATGGIPIVMVGGAKDPVEEKLVASLAVPGGNITGLTLQQVDLVGKRLEFLKEVVPGPAPIAVLWEETSSGSWNAARSVAAARGWQLLAYKTSDGTSIAPACASAKASGAGSLLVVSGGLMFEHAAQVVQAAATHRLAAMYPLRVFADHGGLMSYGANLADLYRRSATFVDRIARGSSPATMPMEQPTKFELVVNMKTARALELTIPQTLLLRADETIQ
jgi:putative tryptophan/tyrosine transport system substrate-binding protein